MDYRKSRRDKSETSLKYRNSVVLLIDSVATWQCYCLRVPLEQILMD
jgi:hypothetical protein